MPWQLLGSPPPAALASTREQLHAAAQVIANVPRLLVPPRPDWSHSAFDWDTERRALVSVEVPADVPFRVALDVPRATALVLASDGSEVARQPVDDFTVEQLFAWLTRQIVDLTGSALPRPLARAEASLPPPATAGQLLRLDDTPALEELARYYEDACIVLAPVAARYQHPSPLRLWPHHMDLACSIALHPEGDPETAPQISLGMQPGDGAIPEPYFYSSPWPYPSPDQLPPLAAGGTWHTEDFTAAILHASTLVAAGDAAAQQRTLEEFASSALAANHSLFDR
jgi:hypothetical protein